MCAMLQDDRIATVEFAIHSNATDERNGNEDEWKMRKAKKKAEKFENCRREGGRSQA